MAVGAYVPPKRAENFIRNTPVEILLKIIQLAAPPHTRDGLYDLSKLTHVCQFWRAALTSQPRLWSTIFATQKDRREFVEACLERSHPVTLDVTMNTSTFGWVRPGCTCGEDRRGRLLPNEVNPCEWHFTFESLATTAHSKRVRTLTIDFWDSSDDWSSQIKAADLLLGGCRFFTLSFPQLTDLEWKGAEVEGTIHLFSNSPFTPTVRSLSFEGSWGGLFTQVSNLTSFTFSNYEEEVCGETFRSFMFNNRSLQSLSLHIADLKDSTQGPPVDLLHLKSLTLPLHLQGLSTIIRVPALRRLSSLQISRDEADYGDFTLFASGDGITLSVNVDLGCIAEVWQELVGYARPTISHIRLCNYPELRRTGGSDGSTIAPLLADAHTLEVGRGYLLLWYHGFVDDLKQLGPKLKTIRFEVWEEMEPFKRGHYRDEMSGLGLLDNIGKLVKYRFEIGRPFSAVERMVVCESERSNRQQDYVWRCFYGDRNLGQYVRPI